MAIGSPPQFESGSSSRTTFRSGRTRVAGLLLVIASAGIAVAAWRVLATHEEPSRAPADATSRTEAAPARTPDAADRVDPDFAKRLLAAAEAAKLSVPITAHVPQEAKEGVVALELVGDYEAPPRESGFAGPWTVARGEFSRDGRVSLLVPAAWPRARALRIVRRDGGAALRRDVPLVGTALDLGEWRSPAGGRIEGVVRGAGGAVAEARVAIDEIASDLLPSGAASGSGALGSRTCDASGAFAFSNVATRHVRVEVSGVAGRANGVVADAEVFGEPLAIELAPAASIRGRLLDVEGRPIAGGRVAAHMSGPDETSGETSAATGADGAFALDALAPGYYSLVVTCSGYATRTIPSAHTDVTGLDLRLDRLAAAHFVFVNGPAGWTAPATWRLVEPAEAGTRWTTPPELAWVHERDLLVRGIPPGRGALEVAIPGAAPVVTPVVSFEPNATTEVGTFTLTPGAEAAFVVTDAAGKPVRARVALASPQHRALASGRDPFLLDHEERVTDAAGRCVWRDLPSGRRVVAARALDGERGGADALAEVDVPASGRVEAAPLVIGPAGAIAGSVRALRGPPLSEMTVAVDGLGRKFEATTDVDGRYEVRGLPPGRYVVTVLRREDAPPRDLGVAFSPRENPTANVEVKVGETTARDFTIDLD